MSTDFNFQVWLQTLNLNDSTLDKLKTADIRDAESVLLLSPYDISTLKIDVGDRGRFRKAIRKLRLQFPDSDDEDSVASGGFDDSFDGSNPEHVARLQIESLKKLQVDQDKLTLHQRQQPQQQPQVPQQQPQVHQVWLTGQGATAVDTSSIGQLTALLSSLQLTLVPTSSVIPTLPVQTGLSGIQGVLLSQSLQQSSNTPVTGVGVQGALPGYAAQLPGAGFFASTSQCTTPHAGNPSGTLASLGSSGLPFLNLPAVSPTIPFTTGEAVVTPPLPYPTTTTLASHPLYQNVADSVVSKTIKDILGLEECGRLAGGVKKGEKPLLPVDFITVIPGVVTGDEDILNEHNGIELVLRSVGAKKPTPDKLNTGQFIEATSVILQLLLPTFSLQDLTDYVEYIRQVGYYMQIFSVGSVFMLDHAHRKNVFYKNHHWNAIDSCLANGTLKQKTSNTASKVTRKTQISGGSKPVSGTPCVNFNDKFKYCPYNPCQNPHRCSVDGCLKNHPAYKHGSNDRFRSGQEAAGTST
jgi:hypothetical protein